jgi:ubiquitin carboxyl-terminal hydrolase 9/13
MSTIFRNFRGSLLTVNSISSSETHGAPNDSLHPDSTTPPIDIIASISSYVNSVLQALYFCNPFRELLLQLPDPSAPSEPSIAQAPQTAQSPSPVTPVRKKPERGFSANDARGMSETGSNNAPTLSGPPIPSTSRTLSSALRSLFVHISKHPGDKGTVAPRAFIEKLKELNELFRSSMHQDAHEFLNYLLNRIVEETEEGRKSAPKSNSKLRSSLVGRLMPSYG